MITAIETFPLVYPTVGRFNGGVAVPTGVGLGVEVDKAALRRFPAMAA